MSCNGDPIECGFEAALGEAEEKIRHLTRERDEAARNAEYLMTVVQRARAIHEPEQYRDELYPWCTYCNRDDNTRDDVVLWPCPTVLALDGKS